MRSTDTFRTDFPNIPSTIGHPFVPPGDLCMLRIRIQGLVALAKAIRSELSNPASPGRREHLQNLAGAVLKRVRDFLAEHRASPNDLPAPTRTAYEFVEKFLSPAATPRPASEQLTLFDSSSFPTAAKVARIAPSPATLPKSVHLTGIAGRVNQTSARLSALPDPGAAALLKSRIADASQRVESKILASKFAPENLTPETRAARGWLAYFSDSSRVDRYLHAVNLALPLLRDAALAKPRLVRNPRELTVLFKPLHGYYVLRRSILTLPTAMIAFEHSQFATLSRMVFCDDPDARHDLFHAVMSHPFQSIRAELDRLGGIVHAPAGLAHDLSAAFERVNAQYFENAIQRPCLVWSRQLTGRKFGHYDFIQDTVMLSRTLDQHDVPDLLVDYIMFHELLHKKHGIRWANGRHHAHTPDFRREEQRFAGHRDAEKMLQALAARHRRRTR